MRSRANLTTSVEDEGQTDDGGQHVILGQKVRPDDPLVIAAKSGKYTKTSTPLLAEKLAFSIPEFCALHGISTSYYFLLRQRNEGPEELRIGRRTLIAAEAAAAWRAERTKSSNPKPWEL
jgi:hypothetical protein